MIRNFEGGGISVSSLAQMGQFPHLVMGDGDYYF